MPLSRYLKSHPDDTGARSVLAISQFMTGNYHGCIETLQSVIGKADLVPQVEYVYAESMIKTGQIGSGTERLGSAGEVASGNSRCASRPGRSVGSSRRATTGA